MLSCFSSEAALSRELDRAAMPASIAPTCHAKADAYTTRQPAKGGGGF